MNNANAVRKNQLVNRYIAAKQELEKAESNLKQIRKQYHKAAHLVIYGTPRGTLTRNQLNGLNIRIANHMRRKVGTMSLRRVSKLPTPLINKIMRM
jgi:hypothetical protein